jgi:hypothetical protein
VVFGRDTAQVGNFPASFEILDLFPPTGDGSVGFVLAGTPADAAGSSASAAGDVNDDGIEDLIVRRRRTGSRHGRSLCGQSDAMPASPFPPAFQLSSLLAANGGDGTAGFVLHGVQRNDYTGQSRQRGRRR